MLFIPTGGLTRAKYIYASGIMKDFVERMNKEA